MSAIREVIASFVVSVTGLAALKAVDAASNKAAAGLNKTDAAATGLAGASDEAGGALGGMAGVVGELDGALASVGGIAGVATAALLGVGTAAAGIGALVFGAADRLSSLRATLTAVTGSAQDGARALGELRGIYSRVGGDLGELRELYVAFARGGVRADLVGALTEAGVGLRRVTGEGEAFKEAIRQMFSETAGGAAVSMSRIEALGEILGGVPAVLSAIGRQTGQTSDQVRASLSAGTFVDSGAVAAAAAELGKPFADAARAQLGVWDTLELRATTALDTISEKLDVGQVIAWIDAFTQSDGFNKFIAGAQELVTALGEAIGIMASSAGQTAGLEGTVGNLGDLFRFLALAVRQLTPAFDSWGTGLGYVISLSGSAVEGIAALTGAVGIAVAVVGGLGGALVASVGQAVDSLMTGNVRFGEVGAALGASLVAGIVGAILAGGGQVLAAVTGITALEGIGAGLAGAVTNNVTVNMPGGSSASAGQAARAGASAGTRAAMNAIDRRAS